MSKWLGHNSTKFDISILQRMIRQQQLPDGSWKNVNDANIDHGDIDTSLFNYWAMKVSGVSYNDPLMVKARNWITFNGGIESAMVMTKWWLALNGNYAWTDLPSIPMFAFDENWINKFVEIKDEVSQWVYPHILPMCLSMLSL